MKQRKYIYLSEVMTSEANLEEDLTNDRDSNLPNTFSIAFVPYPASFDRRALTMLALGQLTLFTLTLVLSWSILAW